ncbi:hypothetical protein ACFYVL_01290 [Streptomyces sp. NPDC004111]|uniref:hypothetical protein n=1 Tax=Streptomyces sp. NPDC004111 TaxID=3364690 RepID=UPI0036C370E3
MSTATALAPAGPARRAAAHRALSTTRTLARLEVRHLLTNAWLWCALAVGVAVPALITLRTPQRAEWAYDTQLAGTGLLLPALALMATAGLAAQRERRNHLPETLAALPASVSARTLATAFAHMAVALVTTLVPLAAFLLWRHLVAAPQAGVPDVAALWCVPAGALLLVALGIALGCFFTSPLVFPASVFVLLVLLANQATPLWPLPLTSLLSGTTALWPGLSRLLYLLVAVLLLLVLALSRHRRSGPRTATAALALLGLVPLALTGSAAARRQADDPHRTCTAHHGVTYCHFDGFAPWIPLWAAAAEPVRGAVPGPFRAAFPTLTQYRTTLNGTAPGAMGTQWATADRQVSDRGTLAGRLAATTVGLAPDSACDATGQARTVLALYLTGHAVPLPERVVWDPDEDLTLLGRLTYTQTELALARQALAAPGTPARVADHWAALVRPDATTDDAAKLLGLNPTAPQPPSGKACA